jgi:hypothetical protein
MHANREAPEKSTARFRQNAFVVNKPLRGSHAERTKPSVGLALEGARGEEVPP